MQLEFLESVTRLVDIEARHIWCAISVSESVIHLNVENSQSRVLHGVTSIVGIRHSPSGGYRSRVLYDVQLAFSESVTHLKVENCQSRVLYGVRLALLESVTHLVMNFAAAAYMVHD